MQPVAARCRHGAALFVFVLQISFACPQPAHPQPLQAGAGAVQEIWSGLLARQPFPYRVPLPEPRPAEFDGTYVKRVTSAAEPVHCLRCPDYAPEGGLWRMRFDRGVFRILHLASGWKSIATAIAVGDRLLLANDPVCIDDIGLYRWRLEEGRLVLEVIDDPCAIRLRAANLGGQAWQPCRPPNVEAAVTGHWPEPEGCE